MKCVHEKEKDLKKGSYLVPRNSDHEKSKSRKYIFEKIHEKEKKKKCINYDEITREIT